MKFNLALVIFVKQEEARDFELSTWHTEILEPLANKEDGDGVQALDGVPTVDVR